MKILIVLERKSIQCLFNFSAVFRFLYSTCSLSNSRNLSGLVATLRLELAQHIPNTYDGTELDFRGKLRSKKCASTLTNLSCAVAAIQLRPISVASAELYILQLSRIDRLNTRQSGNWYYNCIKDKIHVLYASGENFKAMPYSVLGCLCRTQSIHTHHAMAYHHQNALSSVSDLT